MNPSPTSMTRDPETALRDRGAGRWLRGAANLLRWSAVALACAACGHVPAAPEDSPVAAAQLVWPRPPAPARVRLSATSRFRPTGASRVERSSGWPTTDRAATLPLRAPDRRRCAGDGALCRRSRSPGAGGSRFERRAGARRQPGGPGDSGIARRRRPRSRELGVPGGQRLAQGLPAERQGRIASRDRWRGTAGAAGRRSVRRRRRPAVRVGLGYASHHRVFLRRAHVAHDRRKRQRAGSVQLPDAPRTHARRRTARHRHPEFSRTGVHRESRPLTRIGRVGDGSGDFASPKGVGADSSGHLYVVDAMFDAVQVFDRAGALLLAFGDRGTRAGQFWLPNGLFVDDKDRVYVADAYNQRVSIFERVPQPAPEAAR